MSAVKIARFVNTRLTTDVHQVLFTRDDSGKYYLFGKYIIANVKNIYKVYSVNDDRRFEFSSLKHATAWCVLTNASKYIDARRIEMLDLKLSSIDVDIAVHKNKIKTSTTNFNAIVSITKLQEDTHKRRMILSELTYYLDNSKRIQNDKFNKKDSKIKHRR